MVEKPVSKSWADEEDDDENPPGLKDTSANGGAAATSGAAAAASAAAAAALKGLSVSKEAPSGEGSKKEAEGEDGVVDQPDISIKSGQLKDMPDGSEHEIKSVSTTLN